MDGAWEAKDMEFQHQPENAYLQSYLCEMHTKFHVFKPQLCCIFLYKQLIPLLTNTLVSSPHSQKSFR